MKFVRPKTVGNRKDVLTYDDYRNHLTLKALEKRITGDVIVYCLPVDMSGKSQPLHVELYGPFKAPLNDEISWATQLYDDPSRKQYQLLHMIKKNYDTTFASPNAIGSFSSSGIFPVNCLRLFGTTRPWDGLHLNTVMEPQEQENLLSVSRNKCPLWNVRSRLQLRGVT